MRLITMFLLLLAFGGAGCASKLSGDIWPTDGLHLGDVFQGPSLGAQQVYSVTNDVGEPQGIAWDGKPISGSAPEIRKQVSQSAHATFGVASVGSASLQQEHVESYSINAREMRQYKLNALLWRQNMMPYFTSYRHLDLKDQYIVTEMVWTSETTIRFYNHDGVEISGQLTRAITASLNNAGWEYTGSGFIRHEGGISEMKFTKLPADGDLFPIERDSRKAPPVTKVPLLFNGSELATTSGLGLDEGILTSRPSNYVEARYSLQPNGKDWILTLIDGEAVVVINDPANLQNNPTAVLDGMLCHFRVRAVGPKRWGLEGWIEPSSH